ncbi:MFS general substrate transporter [Sistotremastrum niveocremeum HHB9708]|uniref:MFS general substrate transporter n=1 Tax=Sistotremastrum niveocremeum HHB9708 TaxID=1314777 RepID=A0A164WZR6_9AGAM|nr:MFS general substrate transporter [Sistotremastrum niveocremeum HHB9708]
MDETDEKSNSPTRTSVEFSKKLDGLSISNSPTNITSRDILPALSWDSSSDPENPKNWPRWRKVSIAATVSAIGFLAAFTSAAFVVGAPEAQRQFHVTNDEVGILTTSMYLIGFGTGPFFIAPLSEVYGRKIVYCCSVFAFACFQLGCALSPNMTCLIILRFLAGTMGSMAPALGPASMADLYPAKERGQWTSVLTMGVLAGPPLGNLFSAFLIAAKPWQWIFWLTLILSSTTFIVSVLVLRETYEPYLLRRRAWRRLNELKSTYSESPDRLRDLLIDIHTEAFRPPSLEQVIKRAVTRPFRFLTTNPICGLVGMFGSYTYGMLYLILVSIPLLFKGEDTDGKLFNYGFNATQTGLCYLSLVVGFVLGGFFQMHFQHYIYLRLTKLNGESRPEYRLFTILFGLPLFPVSLLLYGWSAQHEVHFMVPLIALAILAFGVTINFQSTMTYTAEGFIPYAASASAATVLMRSISAAVFPLFGQLMFKRLGYGWAGTILGLAVIPALPVPYLLYRHGKYLRTRFAFKE